MCSSLLVLRAPGSPLPLPHRHRTSAHLTSTLPLPRRDPHHHQYSPTSAFEDSPSLPFATRHRIGVTVAGPSFKVSNETEWCNITTAEVELSFYKPGTSLPDAPVPVAASNLHLPPDSCAAGNIHPDSDVACVDRPCNRSQPDPLHKQTRSTCCSHCNADAGCGSCTYNMRCTAVVRQCSLPYLCLRLQPHSLPYNHSPHFLCSSPCCRPPFRVAGVLHEQGQSKGDCYLISVGGITGTTHHQGNAVGTKGPLPPPTPPSPSPSPNAVFIEHKLQVVSVQAAGAKPWAWHAGDIDTGTCCCVHAHRVAIVRGVQHVSSAGGPVTITHP